MKYEVKHAEISVADKRYDKGEVVDEADLGEYVAWFCNAGAVEAVEEAQKPEEKPKPEPEKAKKGE